MSEVGGGWKGVTNVWCVDATEIQAIITLECDESSEQRTNTLKRIIVEILPKKHIIGNICQRGYLFWVF